MSIHCFAFPFSFILFFQFILFFFFVFVSFFFFFWRIALREALLALATFGGMMKTLWEAEPSIDGEPSTDEL